MSEELESVEESDNFEHYGKLGMKWGVHRAIKKAKKIHNLEVREAKKSRKAHALYLKSEKAHAKEDLGRSNRHMIKSERLARRGKALERRAARRDRREGPDNTYRLKRRAAKLARKSAKHAIKGKSLSRTTGYGNKAEYYAHRGDRLTYKAAKARHRIARRELYINKMKMKANAIPKDQVDKGYAFVKDLYKLDTSKKNLKRMDKAQRS